MLNAVSDLIRLFSYSSKAYYSFGYHLIFKLQPKNVRGLIESREIYPPVAGRQTGFKP